MDDHALLEAARTGDRAALEAFVDRYQGRVLRFGLKMCRDPEVARDVAQDTLLAASRGVGRFREAASPSTWLYAIARSFCIKKRRRRQGAPARMQELEAAREVPDPRRDPERELADRELGAALDEAIAALGPSSREVLVLRDVEGLSAAEVAEVTGLGVGAVKSRLHRARLQVRERLDPILGRGRPGAGCPDVLAAFSRHLEGEIAPADCAAMEKHLAGCARCTHACQALKRVLSLCQAAPVPEVPGDLRDSVRAGLRALLGPPA